MTSDCALFLDRDGVIVEDVGYLRDPADVRLVAGVAALVQTANAHGIPVIVVTNQSGVARGLYSWAEFSAVEDEIARQLAAEHAVLDATLACPFHPDFTPGYGPSHARFRKPGPGMIELACARLGLVPGGSWLIGDNMRDCEAARAAGLAGAILLAAGGAPASVPLSAAASAVFRLEACDSLEAAGRLLAAHLFSPPPVPGNGRPA